MRKVYVNLPHFPEIEKALSYSFCFCEKEKAYAIVTQFPDDFDQSCFVITLRKSDPRNGSYFICSHKPNEVLIASIISSLDTFFLTKVAGKYSPYMSKEGGIGRITYLMNKLEHILNRMPESVIEVDLNGDIFFYNKKFASVYQDAEYIIEGNIYNIFDDVTGNNIKRCMGLALQGEDASFSGKIITKKGVSISIAGYVMVLTDDSYNFEIVFNDIASVTAKALQMQRVEEQSIVSGFSKHLSHNVTNALTAAGGFIRQIKIKTESDAHIQNLWKIIDNKLSLVEEIIAGYSDYTHATEIKPKDNTNLQEFFQELAQILQDKKIDRNFTAYLYKFVDNYNLTFDFSNAKKFEILTNKMFLKLAICYIIKDNIRYFSNYVPLSFHIKATTLSDTYMLEIIIKNVDMPDYILESMFNPWNHNAFTQSFDYWGIVIAHTIIERHYGKMSAKKADGNIVFLFEFKSQV